jgi:uncharacterized protein YecE (DUF72 family)
VYAGKHPPARLAQHGLPAYARHPLLRCVGVDRSHYQPMPVEDLAGWANVVPDDFRFLLKAHEACTLARYPTHARYGRHAGERNPLFLDPAYAADAVVAPAVAGLGAKAGPLRFEFAPQDLAACAGREAFLRRLDAFLAALPRGPLYAVEVRNPELLGEDYAQILAQHDAVHCFNVWGHMPGVRAQAAALRGVRFRALVLRWMLHRGWSYEAAVERYKPFDKLVDEDPAARGDIAWLAARALEARRDVYVVVNNKAEGSSPLTIAKLAEAVAQRKLS